MVDGTAIDHRSDYKFGKYSSNVSGQKPKRSLDKQSTVGLPKNMVPTKNTYDRVNKL